MPFEYKCYFLYEAHFVVISQLNSLIFNLGGLLASVSSDSLCHLKWVSRHNCYFDKLSREIEVVMYLYFKLDSINYTKPLYFWFSIINFTIKRS